MPMFYIERVTGRKAWGLQMEEIGCKGQIFFNVSLKSQEETNYKYRLFAPCLYKVKAVFF